MTLEARSQKAPKIPPLPDISPPRDEEEKGSKSKRKCKQKSAEEIDSPIKSQHQEREKDHPIVEREDGKHPMKETYLFHFISWVTTSLARV